MADYVETDTVGLALTPVGLDRHFRGTWILGGFFDANNGTLNQDQPIGCRYAASASGTITSGLVKMGGVASVPSAAKILIYENSGGNPGALLGVSEPITFGINEATTLRTVTFTTPVTLVSGTEYYIMFLVSVNGVKTRYQAAGIQGKYNSMPYATPANPFGGANTLNPGNSFYSLLGSQVELGPFTESGTVPLTFYPSFEEANTLTLHLTPSGEDHRYNLLWWGTNTSTAFESILNANKLQGNASQYVTVGPDAITNKVRIYVGGRAVAGPTNVKVVVYDVTSGNPTNKVSESEAVSIPANDPIALRELALLTPLPITYAGVYWLFIVTETYDINYKRGNSGFTTSKGPVAGYYASPPNPWGSFSGSSSFAVYGQFGIETEPGVYSDSGTVGLRFTIGRGDEVYTRWFGGVGVNSNVGIFADMPEGSIQYPSLTGVMSMATLHCAGHFSTNVNLKIQVYSDVGGVPTTFLGETSPLLIPAGSAAAIRELTFPTPIPVTLNVGVWLMANVSNNDIAAMYASTGNVKWVGSPGSYVTAVNPYPAVHSTGFFTQLAARGGIVQVQGQNTNVGTVAMKFTVSSTEDYQTNFDWGYHEIKLTPITTHECKGRWIVSMEVVGMNARWTPTGAFNKFNNAVSDTKYYASYVGVDPSVPDC